MDFAENATVAGLFLVDMNVVRSTGTVIKLSFCHICGLSTHINYAYRNANHMRPFLTITE